MITIDIAGCEILGQHLFKFIVDIEL